MRLYVALVVGCASLLGGALGWERLALAQTAAGTEASAPDGATEAGDAADDAVAAQAGSAEAEAASDSETSELQRAKSLFEKGNALRKVEDYQGAFAYYAQSLRVVGSLSATLNAAFCLYKLGRYDEALELYEQALTQHESVLTNSERERIGPMIRSLRQQVGSLDVSANIDGRLVIDGRDRGTLPLARAVRVLPGLRRVRVIKDGYGTWEREVTIVERDTTTLDARLKPLAQSGQLVVDAPGTKGAALHVDGALVGTLPFTGRLSPGKHVVWVERGDEGTAPQVVSVVEGQSIRVAPRLEPLGPTFRVVTQPPSAEIRIDNVALGKGAWQGRLPVGRHNLNLRTEGYKPYDRDIVVEALEAPNLDRELAADPNHPRWGGGEPSGLEQAAGVLALEVASTYRPLQGGDFDKVAVLPFREVGAAAEEKRLGAVTAELVRTQLVSEHSVPVADVTGAPVEAAFFEQALADHVEMKAAAQMLNDLGAPGVVTGSVTEMGDSFVLHVRLIDLRSGSIVASTYVKVQRADLVALADEAIVRKTRIGAVYRAAIPGGGQFYNGREHYWKGAIIGGGTLASGATAVTLLLLARGQHQKARDIEDSGDCPSNPGVDPDLYESCQADIESHLDRRDRYRAIGIGAAGVAGALYAWGIVDAAIHGRNYEEIDLSRTEMASRRKPREARRRPRFEAGPHLAGGRISGGRALVTVEF